MSKCDVPECINEAREPLWCFEHDKEGLDAVRVMERWRERKRIAEVMKENASSNPYSPDLELWLEIAEWIEDGAT